MIFEGLLVILLVSGPLLGIALAVGLTISILQATTQVNEMTLAYIPKIVAIFVGLITLGGYIIDKLVVFTTGIFGDFTRYVQ